MYILCTYRVLIVHHFLVIASKNSFKSLRRSIFICAPGLNCPWNRTNFPPKVSPVFNNRIKSALSFKNHDSNNQFQIVGAECFLKVHFTKR